MKKAESGDTAAMRALAMAYGKGDGVDQDVEEAERWTEKAANLGDAEAQSEMANILRIYNRDLNKAFDWEQRAAEQGLPQAQHNLAVCFQDGIGTSANPEKMFYWYKKAAENGYTESKRILANCYIRGNGTSPDIKQGVYWMQQAAGEGDAEAKMRLGTYYIEGIGCPVNKRKGLSLLREAAILGNEKAKELLNSDEVLGITSSKSEAGKKLTVMIVGGVLGAIVGFPALTIGAEGFIGFLICVYLGVGIGPFMSVVKEEIIVWSKASWDMFLVVTRKEGIGQAFLQTILGTLVIMLFWRIPWLCIRALYYPIIAIQNYVQLK